MLVNKNISYDQCVIANEVHLLRASCQQKRAMMNMLSTEDSTVGPSPNSRLSINK